MNIHDDTNCERKIDIFSPQQEFINFYHWHSCHKENWKLSYIRICKWSGLVRCFFLIYCHPKRGERRGDGRIQRYCLSATSDRTGSN